MVKFVLRNQNMTRIQIIAQELSKGNLKEAAEAAHELRSIDREMDVETIEIVRQSMIRFFKAGEVDKALETQKLFDIPQDLAHQAIKHALISSYYDGDLKGMLKMVKKMDLPQDLLDEISEYCESWGRNEEASAMREVFSRQCPCCA